MSTPDAASEPTLFDPSLRAPAAESGPALSAHEPSTVASTASARITTDVASVGSDPAVPDASGGTPAAETAVHSERKRLAEQLDALKRREQELRRALAMADHPELVHAIRAIEGRAAAVSRAEAKVAQGFSKSEARRREVVDKKLGVLRDKRTELAAQIAALETELAGLGTERLATFELERTQALEQLVVVLGTHVAALNAAGLDAAVLIPEIAGWLPEIEAIAKL